MRRCISRWFGLLVVALVASGCVKKEKKKKEEPPVSVEVGSVQRGVIKEYLRFTGDLEGEASIRVYSAVTDRIRSLRVDVGDIVKKGQIIAVIEHSRLRQAVAQVQAQLAMVRSQLAGAQVSLAGAKVARASGKREWFRLKKLLRSGAVGAQQVDLSKTQYQGAITRVNAAIAQVQALRAQIRSLRASVAQARSVRSNAVVRAPITGIVAQRFRQTGDMNMPQMPLILLVRMDQVKVRIQLTGKDLAKVSVGDTAEVSVVSSPGRIFTGKIIKVAPALDMATRTAPAELLIPNVYAHASMMKCKTDADCKGIGRTKCYPLSATSNTKRSKRRALYCVDKHPLKPGMIAKVRSLVKVHKNALFIPSSSILNDSYGYSRKLQNQTLAVLVLDAHNRVVRRSISVGLESDDGRLQVLKGLEFGERIIVKGHNLYRKGLSIQVVKDTSKAPAARPSTSSASKKKAS